MWYALRRSAGRDPALASLASELLQSTHRALIYAVAGVYLVCIVATASWPELIGTVVWLLAPIIVLVCVGTFRLLEKSLPLAQLVWQGGLATAITLAIYLFQVRELAFLYALLPFMAVVTAGTTAGFLSIGMVAGLVLWMSYLVTPRILPVGYAIAVILAGAFSGLVGWTSTLALLTTTEWSLSSFEQARKNLEETRQRRAELASLVKELDRAYHSLERANHMLVLARAEAEEARDARNRLALAVSHELRTPLNFVIGFSELMVNSPDTYADLERWPPGLYEDVQEIHRSSTHLLRLVNDVLDLGQTESLQMMLLKDWSDPLQIVRGVEEMVRPAFARKRLSLTVEATENLPKMFVDTARIRQVLLNLLNNSLRFTEQGGVTIRVGREDEHVLICVQDTGPGIASEDLARIFEPFQQIKQGQWRRREGAGLGLSISRRFIELHGGRIWAESQLGQGSRFFFTLPSSEATPASLAQGRTIEDRYWQLLEKRAQGERLLLALSPQPDAGDIVAQYTQGFQVVATPDHDRVPEQVSQLLPSALLIDRSERAKERIEQMLAELPYDLPIISFPFPGSPAHPGRLPEGVTDYLVKPIQRQRLLDALAGLGSEVRRLLVVDDDPAMNRFVARILASTGDETTPQGRYDLTTAFTGEEALAAVQASRPDAVLLDLMLPDIDGWQVLEKLREEGVPAILVTAYDYPQTRQDGLREVMRITMRRPLSRQELGEVLQHLLGVIRPSYPATADEPVPPKGPAG